MREELDACVVNLGCPAEVHLSNCPHHPSNVQRITLPAEVFDKLQRELDAPPRVLPRLRRLLKEKSVRWSE